MDSFTMCFILFTVGMPLLYAVNECRKFRLRQLARGNVVQDALYQEEPQENVESSDSSDLSDLSDSSDSSDLSDLLNSN